MVMILFGTLCLNFYIKQKDVDNHKRKYLLLLMCLLIFLTLVSYEGGVSMLAMIFAIDFFLYPKDLKAKRTWINYLYIIIPLICYSILRNSVATGAGDSAVKLVVPNSCFAPSITDVQVVLSSAWFTMHHILLWFIPYGNQYIIGYYSWGDVSIYTIISCWGVIVGATLFALFKKNKFPKVGLAISWIILGILPVSNLFAFRNGPYGDYYLACASIGIILLVCSICQRIVTTKARKYFVAFALGIYVLYLYITTLIWLVAWQTPMVMMERTRAIFPKQINIFFNEVNYYIQNDRIDLAKKVVDEALNSGVEDVKYAVAYKYWLDGQYQEAYDFLDADAKVSKSNKWSFYFRGYLLSDCLNRPNDAIGFYEKAISYNSRQDGTYINSVNQLAFIYAQAGNEEKAIELWENIESIHHRPDDIRKNIAIAKRKSIEEQ
jgi:tetratricopeptide (TPR) repeat protein